MVFYDGGKPCDTVLHNAGKSGVVADGFCRNFA